MTAQSLFAFDSDVAILPVPGSRVRTLHFAGSVRVSGVDVRNGVRCGYGPSGALLPVTRTVKFDAEGSVHKCNASCTHARGQQCECSCGGRFHGIHR